MSQPSVTMTQESRINEWLDQAGAPRLSSSAVFDLFARRIHDLWTSAGQRLGPVSMAEHAAAAHQAAVARFPVIDGFEIQRDGWLRAERPLQQVGSPGNQVLIDALRCLLAEFQARLDRASPPGSAEPC